MKTALRTAVVGLLLVGISAGMARGAFLYKNYVVRYDRGLDVLCEPYMVQENEWIEKVFQRKGEIAYRDFSAFLDIFKRINPHVQDVNRVLAGQLVLIPLRKIELGSLQGQASGTVTIPFVTLSNPAGLNGSNPTVYTVQKGDCVSVLVHRTFGPLGPDAYRAGLERFKQLNPSVSNLDLIYVGQQLNLPAEGMAWMPGDTGFLDQTLGSGLDAPAPGTRGETRPISALMQVADALDARLMDRGTYYFPRKGGPDVAVDLSKSPLMTLPGGAKVLFTGGGADGMPPTALAMRFWPDLHMVDVSAKNRAEDIFSTVLETLKIQLIRDTRRFSIDGVSVSVSGDWAVPNPHTGDRGNRRRCIALIDADGDRTPDALLRFLDQHGLVVKEIVRGAGNAHAAVSGGYPGVTQGTLAVNTPDRRRFVEELMAALGFSYTQNATITFPYAGIQVKAVSNLVATPDGDMVFVDFGDLYGDAVAAIEDAGFRVVRIFAGQDPLQTAETIFTAAGALKTRNPTLAGAPRNRDTDTALTFDGVLVENPDQTKFLLTRAPLPLEIVVFLFEQETKTIRIDWVSAGVSSGGVETPAL